LHLLLLRDINIVVVFGPQKHLRQRKQQKSGCYKNEELSQSRFMRSFIVVIRRRVSTAREHFGGLE